MSCSSPNGVMSSSRYIASHFCSFFNALSLKPLHDTILKLTTLFQRPYSALVQVGKLLSLNTTGKYTRLSTFIYSPSASLKCVAGTH